MSFRNVLFAGIAALTLAAATPTLAQAPAADPALKITADALGGVVTSSKGAEAGVWVIAETTDLPTKLAKTIWLRRSLAWIKLKR